MTYRVYSGPRGSQSISPLEKDRHLYKEFSLLDEAMGWARHINDSGRVALLIEGDDGTRFTKQQIVAALKNPEYLSRTVPPKSIPAERGACRLGSLSNIAKGRKAGNLSQRCEVGIFVRHLRAIDPEGMEAERHRAHDVPAVR